MKQTNKLFHKEFLLKFPLSAIDRKTIVLLTGFILLLTCTITGCGSNSQQQSTLPVTEPVPIENPAQEESTQETQNQSVPEQPDMEQPSQAEDNQSQFSPSTQSVPEKAEAETVAPSPDVSSSSPSYLGTWQITSSTFGAYSAMSEEDCSALMGTRFEYFNDYAIYDDQHRLDSPQYIESILTVDDFSSIYQGTSLETLGISKDSIQVVAIENASGIGDTFYIKDENTLIIPWDGVFFEVQRVSSDS
ncbi:hypothetical protein C819_02106 [Lachnospiraceae bacterium 10-1]|nr:hypothetical protein C819_02106 [Lachnospiraceae bacterium 10-1]